MPLERIKILHLLSQRPDSTGSGIYLQAMLRESKKGGHENFLIAGIPGIEKPILNDIPTEYCSFIRFDGNDLPFPIVGMSDVMPYPSYRFCDLSKNQKSLYEDTFAEKIQKAVNSFRPDIIHSHHLWIVTSIARNIFPKLPIVTSCHGSDLRQFQKCPVIAKRIFGEIKNLNAVLALSQNQKTEIQSLYNIPANRIHITGAGYNQELFSYDIKPEPNPIQIVYAGKLSRSKGVPWLLRALSSIQKSNWLLHLVGGGDGQEKEECLILANQLGKRVKIHGPVSQVELAKMLKQSHLFVLPSFFEGLPLVLLEALASGCRLVATALPGILEVLGKMDTKYIQLVSLPRFKEVDEPLKEDEKQFEENLTKAINIQLNAIENQPNINLSPIESELKQFTWPNIFNRVERVYFKMLKTI